MTEINSYRRAHIPQIDYVRAIASCAVAVFHLGGRAVPVLKYGWLGVDMFFLLSGFIICWAIPLNYSWSIAGRFIAKRLLRIEPPYLVSIGIALIAHFIWNITYKPDWFNVLTHLAYINNFLGNPYLNPVYWTLGIEFQFYLLIAICFPFFVKKQGIWLVLLLCTLPLFVTHYGSTLLNVFPLFALGIVYFLYLKGIKNLREAIFFGLVITALSVYISGWLTTGTGLLTLLILVLPLKTNRIVSFLSKISFSLYLTHDIIGSNIVVYMGMLLPKSILFNTVDFLTGAVVSLIFAYIFYILIEQPCLKLSKCISYQGCTSSGN